jgi:hypothetical protein
MRIEQAKQLAEKAVGPKQAGQHTSDIATRSESRRD